MELPEGYEIIQEPLYVLLPPIIEEPLPLPDEQSVTTLNDGTRCKLIRVRKGTEDVVICVAEDKQ